ncbi:EF hand family protein [Histomonas meleagridis]|uniref:EF hand family protein n=1 Tax=Histomonas meleagridis TaxID=135588 RepID=UPI00355AA9DB|nr:EF hand family protein [Histomonas meleagridis]KAH0805959.1 EF hand family protein [Histomonas meleagridis]
MGVSGSTTKNKNQTLPQKTIQELEQTTHFSAPEIQDLYGRFLAHAKTKKRKTFLYVEGFKGLSVKSEQLSEMVFNAFDRNGDKKLDFTEYMHGLSTVCSRATEKEKAQFIFNIVDFERKGSFGKDQLKKAIALITKEVSPDWLPDEQLSVIAETSFNQLAGSIDGDVVDYKKFEAACLEHPTILRDVNIELDNANKHEVLITH